MSTVWAALAEQHKEVSGERDPLYLDDPFHDGVVYRIRYVPAVETKAISKRLSKVRDPTDQGILSAIETILISTEEIMVQARDGEIPRGKPGPNGEDGPVLYPQPLKPLADDGEPPITFEERLCNGFELPDGTEKSAKKIVREMFAHNDYAIIDHAQEIGVWAAGTGSVVREEFAEEIKGG